MPTPSETGTIVLDEAGNIAAAARSQVGIARRVPLMTAALNIDEDGNLGVFGIDGSGGGGGGTSTPTNITSTDLTIGGSGYNRTVNFTQATKDSLTKADAAATQSALNALNTNLTNAINTKINSTEKGTASGVATLGADGKVPSAQLPALGATDYPTLTNKPAIDGNTLLANSTAAGLGLATVTSLVAEQTARSNAITAEQTARSTADTTLQNNINAEATARQTAVTAEATARSTADTTLQSNITAEETARTAADTTLQTNIDTVQTNLNTHAADQTNSHNVTLSQTATAQGTTAAVFGGRLYHSSNSESNKYLTASEIAALYSGGVRYKGRLKYGAMTEADRDGIATANDSHSLTIGDVCGVQAVQLSYEWDGTAWVEQAHGSDAIGDMFLIDYWYGTFDGKTYAGEVQAQIICEQITPTVVFDLYLDTTILLDNSVTDMKIGARTVPDGEINPVINTGPFSLTSWLGGLRGNIKWLWNRVAELFTDKANKFGQLTFSNGLDGNLINSDLTVSIRVGEGTSPAFPMASLFSITWTKTDLTTVTLENDGTEVTFDGTVLIDSGTRQVQTVDLPAGATITAMTGDYAAWTTGTIDLGVTKIWDLKDVYDDFDRDWSAKANKINIPNTPGTIASFFASPVGSVRALTTNHLITSTFDEADIEEVATMMETATLGQVNELQFSTATDTWRLVFRYWRRATGLVEFSIKLVDTDLANNETNTTLFVYGGSYTNPTPNIIATNGTFANVTDLAMLRNHAIVNNASCLSWSGTNFNPNETDIRALSLWSHIGGSEPASELDLDDVYSRAASGIQQVEVEKADKIIARAESVQTFAEYLALPKPYTIELPAGTEHTIAVTPADIAEIASHSLASGRENCLIYFSSVSGDFRILLTVTAMPSQRVRIQIQQKTPEGSTLTTSIYNGATDGSGVINNQVISQIDWLTFTNYDMAFTLTNTDLDATSVRDLTIWQHIIRTALNPRTYNLAEVRDQIVGEVVAATANANSISVDGVLQDGTRNITLHEEIDQTTLDTFIVDASQAADGVIYEVEDNTALVADIKPRYDTSSRISIPASTAPTAIATAGQWSIGTAWTVPENGTAVITMGALAITDNGNYYTIRLNGIDVISEMLKGTSFQVCKEFPVAKGDMLQIGFYSQTAQSLSINNYSYLYKSKISFVTAPKIVEKTTLYDYAVGVERQVMKGDGTPLLAINGKPIYEQIFDLTSNAVASVAVGAYATQVLATFPYIDTNEGHQSFYGTVYRYSLPFLREDGLYISCYLDSDKKVCFRYRNLGSSAISGGLASYAFRLIQRYTKL